MVDDEHHMHGGISRHVSLPVEHWIQKRRNERRRQQQQQ